MTKETADAAIRKFRTIFVGQTGILQELDEFERTKEAYDKAPTVENALPMKMAFQYLTGSMKSAVGSRIISQADYFHYVDALKYFPEEE